MVKGNNEKERSDERPGLVFLGALSGCILGTILFFLLVHHSVDRVGEYWDDDGTLKRSDSPPVGTRVWGSRYQLFGLLIHEEIHWLDHVETHGLPGGYWPWMMAFALFGSGLAGVGVWSMVYRRKK